jgi:GNAT superfamily N-acetyltransferase
MISDDQIQENLYELYADLAGSGLVSSGRAAGFSYIMHSPSPWPNMTYRGAGTAGALDSPDFAGLTELFKANQCPRLVLFEEAQISGEMSDQIRSFRFVPATQWVNMYLPFSGPEQHYEPGLLDCRIADVLHSGELNDWAGTAAEVLFKNVDLDGKLFSYGVEKGLFRLITGYIGERPVSTSLLYFGKLAGVYMVATLPAYQGKGLGKELMRFTASVAAAAGYSSLVLHSTRPGLELYSRLGFREQGKLSLYYCMI